MGMCITGHSTDRKHIHSTWKSTRLSNILQMLFPHSSMIWTFIHIPTAPTTAIFPIHKKREIGIKK